jgi:hypothetical protein
VCFNASTEDLSPIHYWLNQVPMLILPRAHTCTHAHTHAHAHTHTHHRTC